MRILAIIIFIFFTVLSFLIYMTKNYQYEKYVLKTKTEGKKAYLINLNLATWQDFASLPSVSDKLAKNIVKNRDTEGRFDKIEDLMRVKGVSQKKFELIKEFLTLKV